MEQITFIDRITKRLEVEQVYGASALKFLYGSDLISRLIGAPLLHLLVRNPIFSSLYGYWQKTSLSKQKIQPFIQHFKINANEFRDSVETYQSFNDFFIRKLKSEVRPIDPDRSVAIIPADARYRVYANLSETDGFLVKGEQFDLVELLGSEALAKRYLHGTMVIARLCPTDYHRYHFPCACTPGPTHFINGWLYSVNPIALKKDIHIFTKNKRTVCQLETEQFGTVLFLEIGATNVGSIHQTYTPNTPYPKGAEKGYFSFGASSLILLFEPNKIDLDADLLEASKQGVEIRCLMGQSMGHQRA